VVLERGMSLEQFADGLVARLPSWCADFGVPGAAMVLWLRGRRSASFAGVADVRSGAPVGEATRFNLGSIVKLYVATQCLLAVQQGRLSLDRPLSGDWPDLHLPGPWAERITLRHLLTHTGGFEGDVFDDMGRGTDALALFAARCRNLPAAFEPGDVYSYSNVGFVMLGRLLELVHQTDWDTSLQQTILLPCGLVDTGTPFARSVRDGPLAAGHAGSAGAWQVVDNLRLLRTSGPSGATATATVDDLARFGLIHLQACRGQGTLLDPVHEAMMCRRTVQVPAPNGWTAFGLGVMHFDEDGDILGHNGAVDGVWTFLRFVPRLDLVLALMVNGGDAAALMAAVNDALFPALGDLRPRQPPSLPQSASDEPLAPYLGCYGGERYRVDVTATSAAGMLRARFLPGPAARDFNAPFDVLLHHDASAPTPGRFIGCMPGSSKASFQAFLRRGNDPAGILNFRGRSFPRLSAGPLEQPAGEPP
jgi:CubicO group peptidase (beta-lactamase class C family)